MGRRKLLTRAVLCYRYRRIAIDAIYPHSVPKVRSVHCHGHWQAHVHAPCDAAAPAEMSKTCPIWWRNFLFQNVHIAGRCKCPPCSPS